MLNINNPVWREERLKEIIGHAKNNFSSMNRKYSIHGISDLFNDDELEQIKHSFPNSKITQGCLAINSNNLLLIIFWGNF